MKVTFSSPSVKYWQFSPVTVESIKMCKNTLTISTREGTTIEIRDRLACCEERYFATSDDNNMSGRKIDSIEAVYVSSGDSPNACMSLDTGFVRLCNNDNPLHTFNTYNEHNGYYGGLDIQVYIVEKEQNGD